MNGQEQVAAVLLLLYTVCALCLVIVYNERPARTPSHCSSAGGVCAATLRAEEALKPFSPEHVQEPGRAGKFAVQRRREEQRGLLGAIVPVDCGRQNRLCVQSRNCSMFCKDAAVTPFDCVDGVCVERQQDPSKPTGENPGDSGCDTRGGEFALLVGYSKIGVAQWECVQLYPAWRSGGGRTFCEGGLVDIDTRVREPSFRDCMCPMGHRRVVYRDSVLGNTVHGLPHCIPSNRYHLYELTYVDTAELESL